MTSMDSGIAGEIPKLEVFLRAAKVSGNKNRSTLFYGPLFPFMIQIYASRDHIRVDTPRQIIGSTGPEQARFHEPRLNIDYT